MKVDLDLFKALAMAEEILSEYGSVDLMVRRSFGDIAVRISLFTNTNSHHSEFSVDKDSKNALLFNLKFSRALKDIEKLVIENNAE